MSRSKIQYYSQVSAALNKGTVAPAYFIYGDENYLIDTLLELLVKKFLGKAEKEMNYYVRYAPDNVLEDILVLTAGSSLFSERKLIIFKDYQNLRNPDLKQLLRYLEKPDSEICLVIVARVDSVTQARYQHLIAKTTAVHVTPLRENDLQRFIQQRFQKHQKKITEEALQTLLHLVGEKLHDLQSEIDQLVNRFIDAPEITPEMVESVVGVHATQNVFELTRTIAGKDLQKSLFIMHNLIERGENPGGIMFLLIRHLMILWKIRGFYQSGEKNKRTIQQRLKIYPRHFDQYYAELAKWKTPQLNQAIRLLNEGDRALKNGYGNPIIILDRLILKLIQLQ